MLHKNEPPPPDKKEKVQGGSPIKVEGIYSWFNKEQPLLDPHPQSIARGDSFIHRTLHQAVLCQ
jgi:hypothetical protein